MNGSSPSARLTFIAPGLDLTEAIGQLAGTEGWVHGVGHLEEVELRVAAEGADALTMLRGRFNLLSLTGPRGGPFAVTLARLADTGLQVVGGELVRARSAGVTVTLQPAIRDVAVAATKMPDSPATWARAAAASAAAKAEDNNEEHVEELTPEAGDRVQHFAFGVCEVLTSDGDRLRIRDVDGPRRVREVSLSMLRVTGPTMSDGKRLFQLERRVPA